MNRNGNNIETRLWSAADELRANSKLKSSEYSVPVLGLVFLRYADHKFQVAAKQLEGQKGGEFFTPTELVQLIVGIIEPYNGRIFDPARGSLGMFVQSAKFVSEHKALRGKSTLTPGPSPRGRGDGVISLYGQEKVAETVLLGKMNLAVHGLSGDIHQGSAYYEDLLLPKLISGEIDVSGLDIAVPEEVAA